MTRTISLAGALGVAVAMAAMSLQAGAAPKAHIEDPMGDGNFLNDQGTGDGSFGDFDQAGAGTVSDIVSVTFSNDAKNLYVDIETQAQPPALSGVGFRVRVNPTGDPGTQCLFFESFYSGGNNNLDSPVAHFLDACEGGDPVELKLLGQRFVVPRKLHEAFGKGKTLTVPQAQSFLYSGTYPVGLIGPYVDTTVVGRDFKFVDKKRR